MLRSVLVEVTLIGPVASTLGLLAGFGLSLLLGEAQGIPALSFPWATMLAFLVPPSSSGGSPPSSRR